MQMVCSVYVYSMCVRVSMCACKCTCVFVSEIVYLFERVLCDPVVISAGS